MIRCLRKEWSRLFYHQKKERFGEPSTRRSVNNNAKLVRKNLTVQPPLYCHVFKNRNDWRFKE